MGKEDGTVEAPELIPGLEEFWAPDESTEALERDVMNKPPRFAQGRNHPSDYGVVYRGPFETEHDGVCTAVRRNACALRRAKMPVFLQSPSHTHWNNGVVERTYYSELPQGVLAEIDHLTDLRHQRTVCWIEHFVPTLAKLISLTEPGPMGADAAFKPIALKSTAAYVALEYDRVPALWIERFNMFGRVLVPCEANRQALLDSNIKIPVEVVVHPLALKDPMRKAQAPAYAGGTFRFLTMGKWEPRKNQHALIGAFALAFTPEEDVSLTIKSSAFWNRRDYPATIDASIEWWTKTGAISQRGWTKEKLHAHIEQLWNQPMSRQELVDLYRSAHCYVQAGRSEGFDLCAFDAKVAGLRMVAVGWGGPSQFVQGDDIPVFVGACDLHLTPPPAGYDAPEGTLWPAPTLDMYAIALKNAYFRRDQKPAVFDVRPYMIDSVGQVLRGVVESMAKDIGIDLREYQQ